MKEFGKIIKVHMECLNGQYGNVYIGGFLEGKFSGSGIIKYSNESNDEESNDEDMEKDDDRR